MKAALPHEDAERLIVLEQFGVLDTHAESDFDDITELAARICNTPIALISLVDEERQWFKSRFGIAVAETPRTQAFCAHAIHQREIFIVPDAMRDARFADNPLVLGEPRIRFYAGAPLVTREGHVLGTLCVVDYVPRELSGDLLKGLTVLSRQVILQLELRQRTAELDKLQNTIVQQAVVGHQNHDHSYPPSSENMYSLIEKQNSRAILETMSRSRLALLSVLEDQQRTAISLRESEKRFRATFEQAAMGIALVALDGTWLRVNEKLCNILGYHGSELYGRNFQSLTYPDDLAENLARTKELLEGELSNYTIEIRYVHKQNGIIWASLSMSLVMTEAGEPDYFIAVIEDITERKRMSEALLENERHFKRVLDRVLAFTGIVSSDGILEFANKTALDAGGLSAEDVVGKPLEETYWLAWSSETQQRMRDALKRAAAGEVVRYDETVRMAEGNLIDIEISIIAMRDEQGKTTHLIASGLDITERKRVEAILRESEARYRTLLETAPFPVVITRLSDGILRYGNRRAEEKFGISAEQGIGELATDFYIDVEERNAFLDRLLRETTVADQEVRLRGADNAPFWAQISAAIIEYEGQAAIFSSINDITIRKQAEEDVRSLNKILEKRVAKRTAQLEAINKELESFAYSVSHDLKAPLRGIDGYSKLLLEDHAAQLDEEAQTFLHNIRLGAKHMAQLIEDLLAYSRLERRPFQVDQVDVEALVSKILSERSDEIAQRHIEVTLNIVQRKLCADREGIAMVLRNLIDNALKFTARTPHPQIEIGMREQQGTYILWVRDNGIGFDMSFHERIFEIFQRLQLSEDFPGTGIGLAIVRKAAQRMGGRIWAESSPGQGASFFLELPA